VDSDLRILIARLLAHGFLPRGDPLVRRALSDDAFRAELDARLGACGLQLLDNPFAANVTLALQREAVDPVFGDENSWRNNNMGLTRDALALLIVLWALIILPKRERQITRRELDAPEQADLFSAQKPLAHGTDVSSGISEATLIADFGEQLGGKSRILNFNLPVLSRLGFIERRNRMIYEGPLLDLLLDYSVLAPRIMEGALAELLARRAAQAAPPEDEAEGLTDAAGALRSGTPS
jgi:hypothetical protein